MTHRWFSAKREGDTRFLSGKKAVQRNLRLSPLMLRQFTPTGFDACRRSRATGCAGRAARSAAQRQDRGAGESRRNERLFYPKRVFQPVFSRVSALPLLCPGTRLTTSAKLAEIVGFTVRSRFARMGPGASSARKTFPWDGFQREAGRKAPDPSGPWRRARGRGGLERSLCSA